MRIAIVDTYYPAFLAAFYRRHPGLDSLNHAEQLRSMLDACFGTSDFYSRHLAALGHDAVDIIANCMPLQSAWAREHGVRFSRLAARLPQRVYRTPFVGSLIGRLPGLLEVLVAQIRSFRPDVLYCQDLSLIPDSVMKVLRREVRLVVGQIACPLPPRSFVENYDLILTSFPHFVDRLRAMGVRSEYFRIGFDQRVTELLGPVQKSIDVSFVGGLSRQHDRAIALLETLARETNILFFGYGAAILDPASPIWCRHRGEVWGLDMYRTLAGSRITVNRHINVAGSFANNMRLYEATGVGAMLITDNKSNLSELFSVGREVVVYDSPAEAVAMIEYYESHPGEAAEIARAGQARTLREHTYASRMHELDAILRRHV